MRRAFTLIELLVVITILLALALFVVAVFRGDGSEKIREAARISQAAILGAKDRALHAKERRGFRIIRQQEKDSLGNPYDVGTGFAYIQPLPKVAVGGSGNPTLSICRPESIVDYAGTDAIADKPQWLVLTGSDAASILSLDMQGLMDPKATRVRIPNDSTGQICVPFAISNSPPYFCATGPSGETVMLLTTSVVATNHPMSAVRSIDPADSNASAEFDLGNELLPHHQPISLPSGIVIDLTNSSASLATHPDVMYSPAGAIRGPLAALGPIYLLLRDVRDVLAEIDPRNLSAEQRGQTVVAIFPQTGHVATYPVDLADSDGDGNADNLFHFAQVGSTAGN